MMRHGLEANPASDLEKLREPKPSRAALSPAQYRGLRDRVKPAFRPLVRLAVVTGQDLGDLLRLDADEDIAWENGLIQFVRGKTQEPVVIPMGDVAREILEPARFRGGQVFRDGAGEPLTSERSRNRISRHVRTVARSLGIPGSFKNLRTTAGSWASQAGFPDAQIRNLLGHPRGRSMTSRYIDLNPDDLRAMIRRLDAIEQGLAAQSAPGVFHAVEQVPGEIPNAKPTKKIENVGT